MKMKKILPRSKRLMLITTNQWIILGLLLSFGTMSFGQSYTVTATDSNASEVLAPGIQNEGVFTITRTGNASQLAEENDVIFQIGGTATTCEDYFQMFHPLLANFIITFAPSEI